MRPFNLSNRRSYRRLVTIKPRSKHATKVTFAWEKYTYRNWHYISPCDRGISLTWPNRAHRTEGLRLVVQYRAGSVPDTFIIITSSQQRAMELRPASADIGYASSSLHYAYACHSCSRWFFLLSQILDEKCDQLAQKKSPYSSLLLHMYNNKCGTIMQRARKMNKIAHDLTCWLKCALFSSTKSISCGRHIVWLWSCLHECSFAITVNTDNIWSHGDELWHI